MYTQDVYKVILPIFVLLLTCILFTSNVSARSGCCSWHGGVCGNSCCDGTPLSIKCGGGEYTYTPPVYNPPQAPDIKASFDFVPNKSPKTYNVNMSWGHVTNTGFSVALTKRAGGDPGPNTDTYSDGIVFRNITPGRWYANMKVAVNGYWSNVVYWPVDVPAWVPPIATPVPTPFPTPLPVVESSVIETDEVSNFFWGWIIVIGLLTRALFLMVKSKD